MNNLLLNVVRTAILGAFFGIASVASSQHASLDLRWDKASYESNTTLRRIARDVGNASRSRLEQIAADAERLKFTGLTEDGKFKTLATFIRLMELDHVAGINRVRKNSASIRSLLEQTRDRQSLELTRARLILVTFLDIPNRNLLPHGEKLARALPPDLLLDYCLMFLYQPQAFPADKSSGKLVLDEMEAIDANSPYTHKARAIYHHFNWMKDRSDASRTKSIESFRKYMALVGKDFEGYASAAAVIKEMGG